MKDRTKRNVAGTEQRERWKRFAKVFGTVTGKAVLDDILDECGMNRRIFSADARVQEQRVALNDFGLWLLEQVSGKTTGGKHETDDT